MKASVFFVYLCILMLTGTSYSSRGAFNSDDRYASSQNLEKANTNQHDAVIKKRDSTSDKQSEFLVSEDVEDENGNNLSVRKFRLLTSCFFSLPCVFVLNHLYNRVKAPQPFCGHLSFKYAIPKVLRI